MFPYVSLYEFNKTSKYDTKTITGDRTSNVGTRTSNTYKKNKDVVQGMRKEKGLWSLLYKNLVVGGTMYPETNLVLN